MDNMPILVDHKVAIRSLKNLKVVGDIVDEEAMTNYKFFCRYHSCRRVKMPRIMASCH